MRYTVRGPQYAVQYEDRGEEEAGGEEGEEEEYCRQAADTSCRWLPTVDMLSLCSDLG